MLQLLTPITLFITLLATGVLPTHAYWLENPKPELFTMHGVREDAPTSNLKGVLTVQDNFNLFTKQDGTSPILLPHSDYFAAADIIDINIPIFGLFSHPVQQTGDPIANLLYANLRIKKILAEYAEIQERAKDLISNGSTIFPIGKINVQDPGNIQAELKKKTISLATINADEITGNKSSQTTSASNQENRGAILSFQHLQTKLDNAATTSRDTYTGAQKSKIVTPGPQNHSQTGSQQQTNTPQSVTKHSGSHSYEEVPLPWILELPFRIFNYLLSHKIAALVIGFLLLMFINLIFGSRS